MRSGEGSIGGQPGFIWVAWLLLLAACGGGGGGDGSSTADPTITSLSSTQRSPGQALTVTGSGFDPSAQVFVRLFDSQGFDVEVQVADPTATKLVVGVPPYFNVATSQFGASPFALSVEVVQRRDGTTTRSNTVQGVQIAALPEVTGTTGTVTLQWADRMIQENQEATRRLDAMSALFPQAASQAELRTALTQQLADLTTLRGEVANVAAGGVAVPIGQIGGNPVQLDVAALALIDRFVSVTVEEVRSASGNAALTSSLQSTPFRFKPGAPLAGAQLISNFQLNPADIDLDELFAPVRENIRRNRDIMTRVGAGMMATGGLIALVPGGQVHGLALAGLGALTWSVGLHAHTGILLALDIGTTEALSGQTGYNNVIQDMREYITEVGARGLSNVVGNMNETVGTFSRLRTVLAGLVDLSEGYVESTRQSFESGAIPAAGASGLPADQSCCVIHGGCPGETGTQCALNCCCCGAGEACNPTNPTGGCVFVGF